MALGRRTALGTEKDHNNGQKGVADLIQGDDAVRDQAGCRIIQNFPGHEIGQV